ncbi:MULTISPECIES: hypothetical protein [unclassified Thiocapsa]|uniref:hypothetical protein n=1 Tax=unclassified Thiocapsa TaxID=2641286 RepID=UPI0035B49381
MPEVPHIASPIPDSSLRVNIGEDFPDRGVLPLDFPSMRAACEPPDRDARPPLGV